MTHLSPREKSMIYEVLRDAPPIKQIAFRLGVSEATMKVYFHCLRRKVGVSSMVALALWAERSGQFATEPTE